MRQSFIIFCCLTLVLIMCVMVSRAEEPIRNPIDWLGQMEIDVLGSPQPQNLLDRLSNFELMLTGKNREGSLVERLSHLQKVIYQNQPHDVSIVYKTQALEWVMYKEIHAGPLKSRLEQMEQLLFGRSYTGPFSKRFEKLVNQVFPKGAIEGQWTSIPEGLLVKVRMIDELSSKQNKAGDLFKYEIAETVFHNQTVVFAKGAQGIGRLQQVKKPGNLGRDAMLVLDFAAIRALDGTPIPIFYGAKASEKNDSHTRVVGASTAGMLVFGPQGILFGMVIRGNEKVIKTGTEFYVQVKEPARIYTLTEERR